MGHQLMVRVGALLYGTRLDSGRPVGPYGGQVRLFYHSTVIGFDKRQLFIPVTIKRTRPEFTLEDAVIMLGPRDREANLQFLEEDIVKKALKELKKRWKVFFESLTTPASNQAIHVREEFWSNEFRKKYKGKDDVLLYERLEPAIKLYVNKPKKLGKGSQARQLGRRRRGLVK